jgi:alcohol dehydrogenase
MIGRVAVFTSPGTPQRLELFPVPEPVGAEVRVRVTACTLCGSDLHTWAGRRSTPTPTVLGHEIIGTIDALGPDASTFDLSGQPLRVGDRVTWSVVASCGCCVLCQRNFPMKCERMVKYGHEVLRAGHVFHGGLAEFCLLAPGSAILRLPETLPDATACPANCATATVAAALRVAGEVRGRVVLVQGAGLLGLTACALARQRGASAVVCCEVDTGRRELAASFGATATVALEEMPDGIEVALEMTGSPTAFEAALPRLATGATYVQVGAVFPSRPAALPVEQLVRRWLTLRGVHNYAPMDLTAALEFLGTTPYPFADLVAEWLPLDGVETAFQRGRDPTVLRVGVRP